MSGKGTSIASGEPTGKSGEVKRAQIPVRTTPAVRDRLLASASANGRSLTQEIEQRLERSVALDDLRGSPDTARLVEAIAGEVALVEQWTGKAWKADYPTYYAMTRGVRQVLGRFHPPLLNLEALMAATRDLREAQEERDTVRDQLTALGLLSSQQGLSRLMSRGLAVGPLATGDSTLGRLMAKALQDAAAITPDAYEREAAAIREGRVLLADGNLPSEEEREELALLVLRLRELEDRAKQMEAAYVAAYQPQQDAIDEGKKIVADRAAAISRAASGEDD
jgi:hypothetical protein